MISDSATSGIHAVLLQTKAELAAITCGSREKAEQIERDDQRLFFLLNANTARKDYFEIRSSKNGQVRWIIINADADIIFDSENKVVVLEGNGQLPEFDEINEQFSRVIADDCSGREYYRKLRGLTGPRKIPHDLPRAVRDAVKRVQQEEAARKARELRQVIVDNFRSQDCLERQGEIDKILPRKDKYEQEQVELQARQDSLQQALLHLEKQAAELELKHKQEEEADNNAKHKREHDSKRLEWLNRFDPPAPVQPVPAHTHNSVAKGCQH